jgi:cellulose synthase/poly-beta-1,6-N-acetylglucosamine synthase-like glycosyltransferase
MLALIACRNDAAALRESLPSVLSAMRPEDRLRVVADRCSDDTAAAARSLGAAVVERRDGEGRPGKAGALLFGLEGEGGFVAVFDADSRPCAEFFASAQRALAPGEAGQSFVDPVPGNSLLSRLSAYSEIVSQRISDRLRERVGWSVPLRGTGMVMEGALLRDALARCSTEVEDLELTLLIAARGIPIRRLPVSVSDPKPTTARGLSSQRARWLAGQVSALIHRRREILRLCVTAGGATLVLSLFGKPRSLFFAGRALLLALLLIFARGGAALAAEIVIGALLLRDLAWLAAGLAVVDRPGFYLPALLAAPFYPLLWAVSAARSLGARGRWLSSRRPS